MTANRLRLTAAAVVCTLLCTAPALAEQKNGGGKPEEKSAASKAKPDFDLSKLMAVFDKIFPPQPEPAPAKLALARSTAAGMLPTGTYASLFEEVMGGMVERVLALSPSDFVSKPGKGEKPGSTTLRQQMIEDDPHFEERMRIMRRVIGEELVKISALIEPRLREGLARSMARRFDDRQLTDINTFLSTPSGKAFAGQAMKMWIDPDVMRSMVQAFPEMITAVPGAMARLEAATAHLPKPKKRESDPAVEAEKPGETDSTS